MNPTNRTHRKRTSGAAHAPSANASIPLMDSLEPRLLLDGATDVPGQLADQSPAAYALAQEALATVDHFDISQVGAVQIQNYPITGPLTITARDADGNVATDCSGCVNLSARAGSGSPVTVGTGTSNVNLLLTPGYSGRSQAIYLAGEIGTAMTIRELSLNLRTVTQTAYQNLTIRMKHTTLSVFGTSWDSDGWTTVYQQANPSFNATGWATLRLSTPFAYDGVQNIELDISYTAAAVPDMSGITVYGSAGAIGRRLYTTLGTGDPLTWSGTTASPRLSATFPNVIFNPMVVQPLAASGNFVQGVWTGRPVIPTPLTGEYIFADDGLGHSGASNTFTVQASPTLTFGGLPARATEGAQGQAALSIPYVAPWEMPIALASSDTSEFTLPAIATIPAGQTQATFTWSAVADAQLDGTHAVTVTAALESCANTSATLSVDDAQSAVIDLTLANMGQTPGTLAGGGTISVDHVLGDDVWVTLASSNPSLLAMPAGVLMRAGHSSETFPVTILDDGAITGDQSVVVTASAYGWTSDTSTVLVHDLQSRVLTISALWASEGNGSVSGTVSIGGTLPTDTVVTLTSSDLTELGSTTVTVPAGKSSASFSLNVIDDTEIDGPQKVTLTGHATGFTDTAISVSVSDNESLTISLPSAAWENAGTLIGRGSVTISTAQASNLVLSLTSDNPLVLSVPATVTILAGQKTATFNLQVIDDAVVDGNYSVRIEAATPQGAKAGNYVNIADNESPALKLTMPSTATEGNGTISGAGQVSIGVPLASDLIVTLVSGDTSELTLPASVTIPAGQTSVAFAVTVVTDDVPDGDQTVTSTASAAGFVSGQANMKVLDNKIDHSQPLVITLPASVWENDGVRQSAGTVTIHDALPSDLVVTLTSSDAGELAVPASITIPAGTKSASFNITAIDDAIREPNNQVTVRASGGLLSASATMTVKDNEIDRYSFAGIAAQRVGVSTSVNASAVNVSGDTLALSSAGVSFSAATADGPVVLASPSSLIVSGSWRLGFSINAIARGVVLTITDTSGLTGSSTPFDVTGGPVDHFVWDVSPTGAAVDSPFAVQVTAKDANGNTTSFDGPPTIVAQVNPQSRTVVSGSGGSLYLSSDTQSRYEAIYLRSEVGAAGTTNSMGLYFGISAPATLKHWTIRMKHTTASSFGSVEQPSEIGWTTVYQGTLTIASSGWADFLFQTPFEYNGVDNLIVDFSTDYAKCDYGSCSLGSSYIPGRAYSWSGINDSPTLGTSVPNMKLSFGKTVPLAFGSTPDFADGVWSGYMSAGAAASGLVLRIGGGSGHLGDSAAFSVSDIQSQVRGDIWHDRNGDGVLQPGDEGQAGVIVYADLDHDGRRGASEPFSATDATGYYSLHVPPGTYTIATDSPCWRQTLRGGLPITNVTVGPYQITCGNDFAIDELPGSVSGHLWDDMNQNGVQDANELPLSGWTVYIDADGDSRLDAGDQSTLTDAQGNYTLVTHDAGTHNVQMIMPTGWKRSSPGDRFIVAASGQDGMTLFEMDPKTGQLLRTQPVPIGMSGWLCMCMGPESLFMVSYDISYTPPTHTCSIIYEVNINTGELIDADILPYGADELYLYCAYVGGKVYLNHSGNASHGNLLVWDPVLDTAVDISSGWGCIAGNSDNGTLFVYGAGGVQEIDPQTGNVLRTVTLPSVPITQGVLTTYFNGEFIEIPYGWDGTTPLGPAYRIDSQNGSILGTINMALPYGMTYLMAVASDSHGAVQCVTVGAGQDVQGVNFGSYDPRPGFMGTKVFANHSALDGNDQAASAADDAAIMTGKFAMSTNDTPQAGNITAYSRGLNGVMIDVRNLAGIPTAGDFGLRVCSGGAWSAAPAPAGISVRHGAGAGGSDRVTITWSDNVVAGGWLEVTVKAGPNTGLPHDEVFCYGNLPGDANGSGKVDFSDYLALEQSFNSPDRLDADFNASGRVDFSDYLIMEQTFKNALSEPLWIEPPHMAAIGQDAAFELASEPIVAAFYQQPAPVPASAPQTAAQPPAAAADAHFQHLDALLSAQPMSPVTQVAHTNHRTARPAQLWTRPQSSVPTDDAQAFPFSSLVTRR